MLCESHISSLDWFCIVDSNLFVFKDNVEKKEVKIHITHFGMYAAQMMPHLPQDMKSMGFISSSLNLTVEEQEGFKRKLMNWPFPFSSVSYLNKNPADLFSRVSSLRTPSSPSVSPTQHEHSSSKLVLSPVCASVCADFFNLTHKYRQGRVA